MNLLCRILGHKSKAGKLQRSPYTCHTHYRIIKCVRCGEVLCSLSEYHDAITEAELFKHG